MTLAIFAEGLAALLAILLLTLLTTLLATLLEGRRGVIALCGSNGCAIRVFCGGMLRVVTLTMLAIPVATTTPPATPAPAPAAIPRRAFGTFKAFCFRGLTGFAGFLLGRYGLDNFLVQLFLIFGFGLVGGHKACLNAHS
jgi:hypothetical protein